MNASGRADNPLAFPWYKLALNHINKHAHGELLEVGCGRGGIRFVAWKFLPALTITAVDFSHCDCDCDQ
jgi:hypothetical protein